MVHEKKVRILENFHFRWKHVSLREMCHFGYVYCILFVIEININSVIPTRGARSWEFFRTICYLT